MTVKTGLLFATMFVFGCARAQPLASSPARPAVYTCHRATTPIVLDGKLDEPAWASAEVHTQFYFVRPGKGPAPARTKLRLLWDDENLYVAFECVDDDVWSSGTHRDDPVWHGDVVELALKPSKTKTLYYEFGVNPSGVIYDARYPSRGGGGPARFSDWNATVRVGVKVDGTLNNWHDTDRGWTVEMAIPWSALNDAGGRPAVGAKWTFAAARYDFSKSLEQEWVTMSVPPNETGYQGFHGYEAYDWIVFNP